MSQQTHSISRPTGAREWFWRQLSMLMVIPAGLILIGLLWSWVFAPDHQLFADIRHNSCAPLLVAYIVLNTVHSMFSLKTIIEDYVRSPRLLALCWGGMALLIVVLPVLSIITLVVGTR